MLLTENNIKSELSYAYLHAIAAKAGFSCQEGNRHEDGIGVDAKVRVRERFGVDSILTNFSIDIQLKATSIQPVEANGRYSYSLPLKNYDELRSIEVGAPQLLVVLFLPIDSNEWLVHSAERLVCQKCAYSLSLWGAPASTNKTEQTVYLPVEGVLSPAKLRELAAKFSRQEKLRYD
jgi:hypothetical protein